MNDFVLANCKILKNNAPAIANVGVKGGIISEVSQSTIDGKKIFDCLENFLMPGIIDCHVHFRVPGFEKKEDWRHASRASLAGGITTVLDMPNNFPPITTVDALARKRKIVQKESMVNFGFHFGATAQNISEIDGADHIGSVKVFLGHSTASQFVKEKDDFKKICVAAKKKKLVVCVHAEDQRIIEENEQKFKDSTDPMIHSKVRDSAAEEKSILEALEAQKDVKNRLHICHVSSKEGVALLREAKEKTPGISCEVTPHHLFLTEKDLARLGNFGKVNPSIKGEKDKNALWKAVLDGTIDCIGSDHAPHLAEEKMQSYWHAPSGMPGVETMGPLVFNAVEEKRLSLSRAVELLCINPAKIFGIKNKGELKKGLDADFALVDFKKTMRVDESRLLTKCAWSAFKSMKLKGVVEKTIINGQIVFDQSKFLEGFLGKEVF